MRRRRSTLAAMALALTVVVACDAPTADRPDPSYNPTSLTGGLLYRWQSGTTIRVWVVPNPASTSPDLGLAVRQAIRSWNDVRQFAEFTLSPAANIGEANIIVYDRENAAPVSPGSCPFDPRGSAGYTYFCPGTGTPRRAERLSLSTGAETGSGPGASVVIRLDRGRASPQGLYNAIVAHELGHALGIGAHSDVAGDLMFGFPTVDTPSARDRATLRFVLGRTPGLIL